MIYIHPHVRKSCVLTQLLLQRRFCSNFYRIERYKNQSENKIWLIFLLLKNNIKIIQTKGWCGKMKIIKQDIYNKNNDDEHIRITEKNILFKYKSVIKYYYIFSKLFSSLSLKGKLWETPTYNIIAKSRLSVDELNDILEKINDLNNHVDGNIIINYKGNKKFANKNDIDKIFWNYFAKNSKIYFWNLLDFYSIIC